MLGTIPPTFYLLVCNGIIRGEFDSLFEAARFLGINISDEGVITFMKRLRTPSYGIEPNGSFTKYEAVKDWAKCYMLNNLPSSYTIYRVLH